MVGKLKYLALVAIVAMVSCRKQDIAPKVDCNITLDKSNSYLAGDPVVFNISGEVDNLVFYADYDPESDANAIVVKNLLNKVSSFSYVYDEPGTFRPRFVGINSNYLGSSRQVQDFTINIIEK